MSEVSEHAQRLLDDPVLTAAFKAVIDEMTVKWIKSPIDDPEGRENCYRMVVAVDRVRGMLRRIVDDAKFEAAKAR